MENQSPRSHERSSLRRLSAGAAVTAIGVNVVLFLQTAMQMQAAPDVQSTIISAVDAFLPGAPRPPQTSPAPGTAGATPVATSHPS